MDITVFVDEVAAISLSPTGRRLLTALGHQERSRSGHLGNDVVLDYTSIERRLLELYETPEEPAYVRPKKFKDVPFWCKRR